MKTLDPAAALATVWQGEISGLVPTQADATLGSHARDALQRFAAALDKHVLFPATAHGLIVSETDEGIAWRLSVAQLHGREWIILCNLLAFAAAPGTWPGALRIAGPEAQFALTIVPRLYEAPVMNTPFAIDLDKATGYLNDFVLRIEFESPLPAEEREAFCQALEAWAGIVDRKGAFPMEESPTLASVIGPHVCRFEDPATALVEGEGLAAAPGAFAPVLGLCQHWAQRHPVSLVSLEVAG